MQVAYSRPTIEQKGSDRAPAGFVKELGVIWTWPAGTNQWGQQWAKWGGGGRSSVVLDLVAFIKIPLTTCLTQSQFPSWMVLTSFWHGKTPAGPNVERSNLPLKWYLPELFRRAFALLQSCAIDGTMAPKGLKLRSLIWDVASNKITPNLRELWFGVWRVELCSQPQSESPPFVSVNVSFLFSLISVIS